MLTPIKVLSSAITTYVLPEFFQGVGASLAGKASTLVNELMDTIYQKFKISKKSHLLDNVKKNLTSESIKELKKTLEVEMKDEVFFNKLEHFVEQLQIEKVIPTDIYTSNKYSQSIKAKVIYGVTNSGDVIQNFGNNQ